MRPSNLAPFIVWCAAGCAIPLEKPSAQRPDAGAPAPDATPGCRLFDGSAESLSGPGRSIPVGALWLWIFDGAGSAAGPIAAPSSIVDAGPPSACFAGAPLAPLALDTSSLGPDRIATPLDGSPSAAGDVLYLDVYDLAPEEPFGVRRAGIAVALRSDPEAPYVAAGFLWTADRPAFGTSVLREDGYLYAYGSRIDGLDAFSEVARVPEDQAADPSAYRYADGGGHFVADVEASAPLVPAGPIVSVRRHPQRDRYVMSYAPTLAGVVRMRSGLGPAGPWSEAVDAIACDVPSDDDAAFCTGGVQHPEAAGAGEIAISYGVVSLSDDAQARIAAAPERYWTRLATIALPDLP